MKSDFMTVGLSLLAGGLAYDKFVNDGKVTDKVVSAVGGGGGVITEKIKETVSGGTNTIKEITNTKEILNTVSDFGNFNELTKSLKETTENFKDKTNDLLDNVSSKIPNNESLFSSSNKENGSFLSNYSSFKKNGGLIGEGSDLIGLGWVSDKIGGFFSDAIDMTQTFYSGAYNIGTFGNELITGQKYKTKKVKGQVLRYPIKEEPKTTTSSGYKKKSSSVHHSSSRSKTVSSTKEANKYIGSKSVDNVVVKSSSGEIKGSYNNKRRMSVNSNVTKEIKKNPFVRALWS